MTLLVALLSQRDPSDLRPQFNFANAIPLASMRLRSPLLNRLAPSSWSDSRKREDRFHGITLRDPSGEAAGGRTLGRCRSMWRGRGRESSAKRGQRRPSRRRRVSSSSRRSGMTTAWWVKLYQTTSPGDLPASPIGVECRRHRRASGHRRRDFVPLEATDGLFLWFWSTTRWSCSRSRSTASIKCPRDLIHMIVRQCLRGLSICGYLSMRTKRIEIIPAVHGKLTCDGNLSEPDIYYILEKWLERHPTFKGREQEIRIVRGQ